ncbi:hypothetical protein M9434_000404 [Picochlorum sp. BPE23]|nr:hypothetical protein M9434_000404 [Picochlorum sp. BPE23]
MSGFRRVQSHHELNDPNHVPTVVIKVGTSSLIRPEQNSLNLSSLAGIVGLVRDLRNEGYRVVLVSSGAVGVGCQRLELEVRPRLLAKKQALAAVGQVHLMRYYDDLFSAYNITCSQVLLTLENLSSRTTYYNAMNTFNELLNYEVIPIVNENDTVAVEQLRIGDNDTLSAQVATLVHADWLFLLTDVDALYTANPNVDPSARPIHLVPDLWDLEVNTSTAGTQWGTGGMATKLTAARMATAGGCNVAICHFEDPGNVLDILRGKQGLCELSRIDIAPSSQQEGREFARGLVNYNHIQVDAVKGVSSKQRLKEFGDTYAEDEIVHRSTICLLMPQKKKVTIINEAGEEEETECDDDDDESIVDPLADSRSTTPALPPAIQFVPASALQGLSDNATDDVSNKLNALKSDKNESGKEWKNELVSIVEEDSDKTGDALAKSIEKINLETNDK